MMKRFIVFLVAGINTVICGFQCSVTKSNPLLYILIPYLTFLIAQYCFLTYHRTQSKLPMYNFTSSVVTKIY